MASFSTTSDPQVTTLDARPLPGLRRPSKLMASSLAARDAGFRRARKKKMQDHTKHFPKDVDSGPSHHPHSHLLQSQSGAGGLRQGSWRTQELERSASREKLEQEFAIKREEAENRIQARRLMVETNFKKHKKRAKKLAKNRRMNRITAADVGAEVMDQAKRVEKYVLELQKKEDNQTLALIGTELLLEQHPGMEEPLHLTCPITLTLFDDPVMAPSGHSYSRAAIVKYINMYHRCPMTRMALDVSMLVKNRCLADAVTNHKIFFPEDA